MCSMALRLEHRTSRFRQIPRFEEQIGLTLDLWCCIKHGQVPMNHCKSHVLHNHEIMASLCSTIKTTHLPDSINL